MNTSLLASIKWVISQQGEAILGDPIKLKKYLVNHTKNEPKEDRVAFGRCIEMGFYAELKKAQNINDRSQIKTNLINELHRRSGIKQQLCIDSLDILDTIIFGNVAPVQLNNVQNKTSSFFAKIFINLKMFIMKKNNLKLAGLGIAVIVILILIFNFGLRMATNEIIDNKIDERIEELKRLTEYQEQIYDQLEQIRIQIEEGQNKQDQTIEQNNLQLTNERELLTHLTQKQDFEYISIALGIRLKQLA